MRPLQFYDLGLEIASSATTEAHYRTAASRVYYGLHHEACCRYFREEVSPTPLHGNSRHAELRDRFNRSDIPQSGRIGQLLGRLSRLRGLADYELNELIEYQDMTFTAEQLWRQARNLCEDLIEALEAYSPGAAQDGCDCPVARR
jgi:hypothetical protein